MGDIVISPDYVSRELRERIARQIYFLSWRTPVCRGVPITHVSLPEDERVFEVILPELADLVEVDQDIRFVSLKRGQEKTIPLSLRIYGFLLSWWMCGALCYLGSILLAFVLAVPWTTAYGKTGSNYQIYNYVGLIVIATLVCSIVLSVVEVLRKSKWLGQRYVLAARDNSGVFLALLFEGLLILLVLVFLAFLDVRFLKNQIPIYEWGLAVVFALGAACVRYLKILNCIKPPSSQGTAVLKTIGWASALGLAAIVVTVKWPGIFSSDFISLSATHVFFGTVFLLVLFWSQPGSVSAKIVSWVLERVGVPSDVVEWIFRQVPREQ